MKEGTGSGIRACLPTAENYDGSGSGEWLTKREEETGAEAGGVERAKVTKMVEKKARAEDDRNNGQKATARSTSAQLL